MRYNLSGKRAFVTGATGGIGFEIAKGLALLGAHVTIHGRSERRIEKSLKNLRALTEADRIDAVKADFGSLEQAKTMSDTLVSNGRKLDIFINNAGRWTNKRRISEDGHELQFQINYLVPFLLTHQLQGMIEHGRVINLSSEAHRAADLRFDDLEYEKRRYSSVLAYGQSKLALTMATKSWSEKVDPNKFTINAVHPGVVLTNIASGYSFQALAFKAFGLFYLTPREGAMAPICLAADDKYAGKSGDYYRKRERDKPHPLVDDKAARDRLWAVTNKWLGIAPETPQT